MDADFINITPDNIDSEHLCCIIRTKTKHPGVEAKRKWLAERLNEGHIFRKLNAKATTFIEYSPLESAWVPIVGENYYYIYCLWVTGNCKGNGYGKELMDYCIADAKKQGRSGVCMLGAEKQKAWLSDQSFAKKFGFQPVDRTDNGYVLLALSFDGTTPRFADSAKKMQVSNDGLTVFYDMQCPFIYQYIEKLKFYCESNNIPSVFSEIDTLEKAKNLPCVFNNWAVFYNGEFVTVNLFDEAYLKKLINKK